MTGEGIAAIIVASGGFLTSLATFINSIRNSKKIDENTRITTQTSDKVDIVKDATNGMKDDLVKTTKLAAFAAGVKSEQDKEQ